MHKKHAPKKKTKSLNDRISRSAELAIRARIHLGYFIFLKSQENLDEFGDVIGDYWDFFRFGRLAHEWAFYVRITNLLTRKNDTDNLPELLDELEQDKVISPELLANARSRLEHINPIRKAIKKIRDKAVAHQDDTRSQRQVYAEANAESPVSLPELTKLSDVTLEVANYLCTARDLPTQNFLTGQIEQLRMMLEALRASTAHS